MRVSKKLDNKISKAVLNAVLDQLPDMEFKASTQDAVLRGMGSAIITIGLAYRNPEKTIEALEYVIKAMRLVQTSRDLPAKLDHGTDSSEISDAVTG